MKGNRSTERFSRHLMRNTGRGFRKHAATGLVAVILSVITGTIVPMLQNHWEEQAREQEIAQVRQDCRERVDESQKRQTEAANAQHQVNEKFWQQLAAIKDSVRGLKPGWGIYLTNTPATLTANTR
jgi:hypothetical protein